MTRNRKVYVAGPISATVKFGSAILTMDEKKNRFRHAEDFLKMLGAEPVIPLDVPNECGLTFEECRGQTKHIGQDGEQSHSWECYMKYDLIALLDCAAIVTLPEWNLSPGACLEKHVAVSLFKPWFPMLSDGSTPSGVYMLANDQYRIEKEIVGR